MGARRVGYDRLLEGLREYEVALPASGKWLSMANRPNDYIHTFWLRREERIWHLYITRQLGLLYFQTEFLSVACVLFRWRTLSLPRRLLLRTNGLRLG